MSHRERTAQQVDPMSSLEVRAAAIGIALAACAYALFGTWQNRDQIAHPDLAGLSLLILFAAAAVLVVQSHPLRAPFTRRSHLLIHALAATAFTVSAFAKWNTNTHARDDWGPISLALLVMGMAPYRPPRGIAGAATISAIYAGLLALLSYHSFVDPAPALVYALAWAVPILCTGYAAAAFSSTHIREMVNWQRRSDRASRTLSETWRQGLARSVQQERVTVLNRDVVPFVTGLLERGEITDEDAATARAISERTRAILVASVDRGWLDGVIEQASSGRLAAAAIVRGERRLAETASLAQRTALRAMLMALFAHPDVNTGQLRMSLTPDRNRVIAFVAAPVSRPDSSLRRELTAYLTVFGVMFQDLHFDFPGGGLALRFSYVQQ